MESIVTPHGIMQIIPHSMTLPDPELMGYTERVEAAQRYLKKRYSDDTIKFDLLMPAEYARRIEAGEPVSEVQEYIMDRITGAVSSETKEERKATSPVYDKMVSRDTDGPDPLVQEPKDKP